MAQKFDNGYLTLRQSCRPCVTGYHDHCRHHPSKDGSFWYDDPDHPDARNGRRLFLKDRLGNEIPRPPCQCEADGHRGNPGTCGQWVSSDWGDGSRCGRYPIRATRSIVVGISGQWGEIEVELCGLHNGVQKRLEKNAEERRIKEVERQREREEIAGASRASREWAQRLQDEFGLPTEGIAAGKDKKIKVAVSPEQAYKILDEVRSLLDEVYTEHPFRQEGERHE